MASEQRTDLEQYVANELFGSSVHVASLDQVLDGSFELGMNRSLVGNVRLGYEGTLGYSEASLPANRVFFVPEFTSIECMTREVATHLVERFNLQASVRVVCYEGIDKGAVVEL